jgi:N-glycosylase/DNA lyase
MKSAESEFLADPNMYQLKNLVDGLKSSPISDIVNDRLKSFAETQSKGFEAWFPELCFCILVANSPARKVYRALQTIGPNALLNLPEGKLEAKLKALGVRFHNRATFVARARKSFDLKERVLSMGNSSESREWLVENIKGLGYKEASHFLRNVGFLDLAILDTHIVDIMRSAHRIAPSAMPKSKKQYLELEKVYLEISRILDMRPGELDLYLWYARTGDIVK